MREKLNMSFWWQQLREEISPAQVIPDWDLRHPPPHPRPCFRCNQSGHWTKACPNPRALTKSYPTCGQWGHWKMDCPRDALASLRRSPPPTPGEWNIHRVTLVLLGRSPLLPKTPAQPYESCSNERTWVPAPWPVSQTRARNLG